MLQVMPFQLMRRYVRGARWFWIAAWLAALSCAAWAGEPGASSPPAGELHTIGTYPLARHGHSVTAVGQGRYFLHGAHIYRNLVFGGPEDNAFLMQRLHAPLTQADRAGLLTWEPWLWLPDRRGWKRLGDLPECRGHPYLQVVTPMADGGVLLTGGLCDEPKMADDPTGHPEYRRTSRLNGQRLEWEASPELLQGRLYHTASRLSDDNVVVVGGQRDPGLGNDVFPVLASVEWLQGGKFEFAADLQQARAGHTATVLDGDDIIVTGGFDERGRALASVERWDRAALTWRPLPSLTEARYGHRATLLTDGRLLVTGGFGADGKALASSELWDPASGTWAAAAPAPMPIGFHDASRLVDGDVLLAPMITRMGDQSHPMAYRLRTAADRWELAATVSVDDGRYVDFIPLVDAQADGSARIFGANFIWRWTPGRPDGQDRPRDWLGVPALARLDEHSVMVIALSHASGSWQRRAWRWDARSGVWQAAGNLQQTRSGHAQAIRLGSGRVLYLADDDGNALHCEMSSPGLDDSPWEYCGRPVGEVLNDSPFELGLLPDGRAMVIANFEEAFIFDESRRHWQRATLEWRTAEQAFGTPVRSATPLAQLVETSASGDSARLDVSAQAARFWALARARRQHEIVINGVVARRVPGRGAPPAMLWNPEKGFWDYIFLDHQNIGRGAVHLPDGCAISMSPPSIFDPKSGTARRLDAFPAGFDTGDNQIVVLADGTVVAVSAQVGGAGSGWFAAKASCAGLAAGPVDGAMPPVYAREASPALVVPTVAAPTRRAPIGWRERLSERIAALPDLTWLSLGVVVMLGLLRWWIGRRKSAGGGSRLDQPVKARTRYLLRITVWMVVIVVLGPSVIGYLAFRHTAEVDECWESARACLDSDSGLIKSVPALGNGLTGTPSGPHIPCRFVGQWSSIHGKQIRRITLADDGTYRMAPLVQGGDRATEFRGHWMVQAGHFVWRDGRGAAELDINRIDSEGDGEFMLIEANGSRTKFERIEAQPSSRCLSG